MQIKTSNKDRRQAYKDHMNQSIKNTTSNERQKKIKKDNNSQRFKIEN